ncbi:MAG TPA: SRPBCC family protein [Rhizomicrobium sp.]|nr:SRPBCC family protein [Rhizomicrobium sp.]
MTAPQTEFLYTTYIKSTPQKVWDAITTPEFARQYWGNANVSDWKPGSKWEHVTSEGAVRVTGEILESVAPKRLVLSWVDPGKAADKSEYSRVAFEIEMAGDVVRLDVLHNQLKPGSEMARGISNGWPRVLSGLKSFLETGMGLNIACASQRARVA